METIVHVIVYPDSKKARVQVDTKRLRVFATSPAVGGRANAETKLLLAEHFNVPEKQVMIIKGSTSPTKIFKVYKK